MRTNNIPAIILSAGSSSRMGFPKALLPYRNGTLIEDQISRLKRAGCVQIIVVAGAYKLNPKLEFLNPKQIQNSNIQNKKHKLRLVVNSMWRLGQFSSIKCGLRSLKNIHNGCLILPVDVPFVPVQTIKKLLKASLRTNADAVIPYHMTKSRKGHPIWISWHLIKKALKMNSSKGRLDKMILDEKNMELVRTVSKAILNNINTVSEWKTSRKGAI